MMCNKFLAVNNHIYVNPSSYEAENHTKSPEKSIFNKNVEIGVNFCYFDYSCQHLTEFIDFSPKSCLKSPVGLYVKHLFQWRCFRQKTDHVAFLQSYEIVFAKLCIDSLP